MLFLDSNVFLYAMGREHKYKTPCAAIIRAVGVGAVEAQTNVEVLQEILYVIRRRGDKQAAIRATKGVLNLFPAILPVLADDIQLACELYGRCERIPPRDAVHAATMIHNGITSIVTADCDFDRIQEVNRIDPAKLTW